MVQGLWNSVAAELGARSQTPHLLKSETPKGAPPSWLPTGGKMARPKVCGSTAQRLAHRAVRCYFFLERAEPFEARRVFLGRGQRSNRTATRPAPGHDTDHSFPRGRPRREVSFRRRRSLSLMISFISAAGRISIVPHFNFTPGDWEMS